MRLLTMLLVLLMEIHAADRREAIQEAITQHRWRDAAALLVSDLEERPGNPETMAELASVYVYGGFPEAAVPLWRQLLPQGTWAYMGLGVALREAGHPAEAMAAFEAGCRETPRLTRDWAVCRFNILNTKGTASWSELEELLPYLEHHNVALAATARAALAEGHVERARQLAERITDRLDSLTIQAEIAHAAGDKKSEKQLIKQRKQLALQEDRWPQHRISVDVLRGKEEGPHPGGDTALSRKQQSVTGRRCRTWWCRQRAPFRTSTSIPCDRAGRCTP